MNNLEVYMYVEEKVKKIKTFNESLKKKKL